MVGNADKALKLSTPLEKPFRHNGFYTVLDNLHEMDKEANMSDFLFGIHSYEHISQREDGWDAQVYLHGLCDVFAQELKDKYGYRAMEIDDEDGCLIYAFCVVKRKNDWKTYYIDVRGITADSQEFFGEFEDFIDVEKARTSMKKFDADILKDYEDNELKDMKVCAKDIIDTFSSFYDIDRVLEKPHYKKRTVKQNKALETIMR